MKLTTMNKLAATILIVLALLECVTAGGLKGERQLRQRRHHMNKKQQDPSYDASYYASSDSSSSTTTKGSDSTPKTNYWSATDAPKTKTSTTTVPKATSSWISEDDNGHSYVKVTVSKSKRDEMMGMKSYDDQDTSPDEPRPPSKKEDDVLPPPPKKEDNEYPEPMNTSEDQGKRSKKSKKPKMKESSTKKITRDSYDASADYASVDYYEDEYETAHSSTQPPILTTMAPEKERAPPSHSQVEYSQGDRPLRGVELSKFALRYNMASGATMPLTADYEFVHENTYLWLFTVMYKKYGEQLKNLLTEDTSNIYANNEPVTIEYSSVALFDDADPAIPGRAALNAMVEEAFTGENLQYYLEGIQNLPAPNPFRSVISIDLTDPAAYGLGMNVDAGTVNTRTSTRNLMPPLAVAAALVLMLGAAATVYKYRKEVLGSKPPPGKNLDSLSRGGTATSTMHEEHGGSLNPEMCFINTRGQEELDQPPTNSVAIRQPVVVVEEEIRDPDLAGWSEFFEATDAAPQMPQEESSLYSIEDFVNEAERNLLGARIRYPSEREVLASDPPAMAGVRNVDNSDSDSFTIDEHTIASHEQ